MAQNSSREASPRNGTQQYPNPATENMELDKTIGRVQSATTPKKDAKDAIAIGATVHADKSKHPCLVSDERRDERGYKATPGSSGPKTQPRAPPSPHDSVAGSESNTPLDRMDIFDWPGEDKNQAGQSSKTRPAQESSPKRREHERSHSSDQRPGRQRAGSEGSSSLLFAHSFDTLSENGDYLRNSNQDVGASYGLLASPTSHSGLAIHPPDNEEAPRMMVALPGLEHAGSDCSMLDMSPIKVAASPAAPMDGYHHQHLGVPFSGPPHHTTQADSLYGRAGARDEAKTTQKATPPPETEPRGPPGNGYDHHWRQRGYRRESDQQVSNPFYVIRSCQKAFESCTYLLPCLRDANVVSVNLNQYGHIRRYQGHPSAMDSGSRDLAIAKRRVESAICAFGGNANQTRPSHTSSIFRLRDDGYSKSHYEQRSSQRYHVTEGRISWDVEADPPIQLDRRKSSDYEASAKGSNSSRAPHVIVDDASGGSKRPRLESSSGSFDNSTDAPKLKYRCKLCGQPKQNHNCTFRQSLQRNIGVQVYSAVNAYTACEPGSLAPTLSKMNNFVSYDSTQGTPPAEENGYPQTADAHHYPSTVTPQSMREGGGVMVHSPQSSLSTHSQEMSPHNSGSHSKDGRYHVHFSHQTDMNSGDRKRSQARVKEKHDQQFHLAAFAPSVSLRPEHYRAVTPFRGEKSSTSASMNSGNYQYPPVPLTFQERKRMSDTLFYFSKEIPHMTSGCAGVLHEAREKNDWDQAVAELLTQIIVGLYCGEGDTQLEGLQQYLLTLGVSC